MTKKTLNSKYSKSLREIMKFYECGICDHIHPWDFNGDCRDDKNRLTLDNIPDDAEILSWDDRCNFDLLFKFDSSFDKYPRC